MGRDDGALSPARGEGGPAEDDRQALLSPASKGASSSCSVRSSAAGALKQRQSPRSVRRLAAAEKEGGGGTVEAVRSPERIDEEAAREEEGGAGLPGPGWMRVGGYLIGHGIRVVTDIEGRDHGGHPFSWRIETAALAVRAEVPGASLILPPGPARSVAFWMGLLYLAGSTLFVFGAAASLFSTVVRHELTLFALVDVPYFVGAVLYQVANYFAMVEPLNEDLGFRQYLWERSALGGQAPAGLPPPMPRPTARWLGFANRLPFYGGTLYFLGGLAYVVMTAVPMLDADPSALAETLAVDTMAVLGGVGFVLGAYCYCFEYGQQLSKQDPNTRASAGGALFYLCAGVCPIAGSHELLHVGFLINSANMLGSLGFLLSGFFSFASPGSVARLLIQAETFVGYLVGSMLFGVGAVLLMVEVYQPTSRSRRRYEELRRLPGKGRAQGPGSPLLGLGPEAIELMGHTA